MPLIAWSEAVHSSSRDFFKFLLLLSLSPWAKCPTFLLGRNPPPSNVFDTGISLNERDFTSGTHWVGCWPKCLKRYGGNIVGCLGDEARSPMPSFPCLTWKPLVTVSLLPGESQHAYPPTDANHSPFQKYANAASPRPVGIFCQNAS